MGKSIAELKKQLIQEFNSLNIPEMKRVTDLYTLKGSFINLEYTMPGGQKVKLWDDKKIYLGAELCKESSDRCFGLVADESFLLVCEDGDNRADPEIILFKKRI